MNKQTQPIPPAPAVQQSPVEGEVVDAQANMAFVAEAISANPALANDPDVAAYLSSNGLSAPNQQQPPAQQPPANQPPAQQQPSDDPIQQLLQQSQQQQPNHPATNETPSYESLLFANASTDAQNAAIVNGTEDIYNHINAKYGMDVKEDFNNWNTFFNSVDKWRTDAQNGSKAKQELEALRGDLNSLPDPLYNAMNAWANGQDWKDVVSGAGSNIDFTKPFDQNQLLDVLNHYYPNEFRQEDLANQDPNTKKVISLAQRQFELDKKEYDARRTQVQNEAFQKEKALKDSVQSSVSFLKETFPALDEAKVNQVRQIMSSNGEATLFRNPDGSYKKEAAKAITLALFGEDEIKGARQALEARNNQVFNMVGNGANRPAAAMPSGYGANSQQVLNQNQVGEEFQQLFEKRYY